MKVVVLYTMKGCPFCGMIKGEFDKNSIDYFERDIDEYREEYDDFSKSVNNDFVPAFMLMTIKDDMVGKIKLCAPERDFEDIYDGVEIVKKYISE